MLLVRLLRLADVKNGLKVQKVETRIKSIEMFDKITVSEIEKSFGAQSIKIGRQSTIAWLPMRYELRSFSAAVQHSAT